jgi:hypothetical protein
LAAAVEIRPELQAALDQLAAIAASLGRPGADLLAQLNWLGLDQAARRAPSGWPTGH